MTVFCTQQLRSVFGHAVPLSPMEKFCDSVYSPDPNVTPQQFNGKTPLPSGCKKKTLWSCRIEEKGPGTSQANPAIITCVSEIFLKCLRRSYSIKYPDQVTRRLTPHI
ncbi:hypothetical protein I7I51_03856, partial [Histoplasma capsulatum]